MNLKENEERYIGSFQRKNVKGEWCNYIITPKVKEKYMKIKIVKVV